MGSYTNTYKFKLQRKMTRDWMLRKQEELITRLDELGVKVNKPYEMNIEQLEMLVKHHRKTVEAQANFVSDQQMEIAESNGLTKEDVVSRVDNLNWDVKHAVEVKKVAETKERRRERRKAEVARMIEQLNAEEEWAK